MEPADGLAVDHLDDLRCVTVTSRPPDVLAE
jgi:hypothetical protein